VSVVLWEYGYTYLYFLSVSDTFSVLNKTFGITNQKYRQPKTAICDQQRMLQTKQTQTTKNSTLPAIAGPGNQM